MLGAYVGFLRAHGEELGTIRKMSLRQMDAWVEVYKENDKNRLIEIASAMRMSQADDKGWKNFIKDLERG